MTAETDTSDTCMTYLYITYAANLNACPASAVFILALLYFQVCTLSCQYKYMDIGTEAPKHRLHFFFGFLPLLTSTSSLPSAAECFA